VTSKGNIQNGADDSTIPSFSNKVTNHGTISGGEFTGEVFNYNTIEKGEFTGAVTNTHSAEIKGGEFSGTVINGANATISGGEFYCQVDNYGVIQEDVDTSPEFHYPVYNKKDGTNVGRINGGYFTTK